jgi:hypothetical protein
LRVLLIDLRGRAPDLHIRTIALERSVAVIVVVASATTATTAGLTPAPPLTLHETFPDLQSTRPIWGVLDSYLLTYRTLGKPVWRLSPVNRPLSVERDASLFGDRRQAISCAFKAFVCP